MRVGASFVVSLFFTIRGMIVWRLSVRCLLPMLHAAVCGGPLCALCTCSYRVLTACLPHQLTASQVLHRDRALEMDASRAHEMTMASGGRGDIEMGIMSFWNTEPGTVELPSESGTAAGKMPRHDSAAAAGKPSCNGHTARGGISQADEHRLM